MGPWRGAMQGLEPAKAHHVELGGKPVEGHDAEHCGSVVEGHDVEHCRSAAAEAEDAEHWGQNQGNGSRAVVFLVEQGGGAMRKICRLWWTESC